MFVCLRLFILFLDSPIEKKHEYGVLIKKIFKVLQRFSQVKGYENLLFTFVLEDFALIENCADLGDSFFKISLKSSTNIRALHTPS